MRKVLIVDDAPEVRRMLERTLSPLASEWEIVLADGARAALERLEQGPYDVVASDMVMPEMDGVQLLSQVKARYPGMVRIAFSGQSAKGYGVQTAGLAHQFLEKPLDVRKLHSIMARSCALHESLADDRLRRVLVGLPRLPSVPAVYQELMQEIHSRDVSLKKIARIISRDLAMVTKILQLVNSAFFGFRTTVSNPEQAVALLGSDAIKALVLTTEVFSAYEGAALPGFSIEELWQHGLAVGTAARTIAKSEQAPQSLVDDAFTAGMLHDVGRLVLAANQAHEYRRMIALGDDRRMPGWQAERDVFGTTHAELGAHLLSLWGVAETVVEAVAFHHRPEASGTDEFTALAAVHVADIWERRQRPQNDAALEEPDAEFLRKTGLSSRVAAWMEMCASA